MKYRFAVTITVSGQAYQAGQEVDSEAIPPGNLDSLLRLRQLVPAEEPTMASTPAADGADQEKPNKPRKK